MLLSQMPDIVIVSCSSPQHDIGSYRAGTFRRLHSGLSVPEQGARYWDPSGILCVCGRIFMVRLVLAVEPEGSSSQDVYNRKAEVITDIILSCI